MSRIGRGLVVMAAVVAGSVMVLAGSEPNASETEDSGGVPAVGERIEVEGVAQLYRLSPRLYSGGQPRGEADLSALAKLGIKTIVSVDGAQPDVETARQLGLRYVHLPIGYDTVPGEQALRMIRAVEALPGPVFIHCHHGKHRGPAAAALCGLATEGWSRDRARAWLQQAGTSPDYRGLYRAVEVFEPPSAAELDRIDPDDLPERAEVPALVEAMVHLDRHWEHLQMIRQAGYRTPPDAPDLNPAHEALQLAEQFRESLRLDETQHHGEDFVRALEASEQGAWALQRALRRFAQDDAPPARQAAETAFRQTARRCSSCHVRFRD